MDETRLIEHGLERRPLSETLRDTLTDRETREQREPRAGLSRAEELELIEELGVAGSG